MAARRAVEEPCPSPGCDAKPGDAKAVRQHLEYECPFTKVRCPLAHLPQ